MEDFLDSQANYGGWVCILFRSHWRSRCFVYVSALQQYNILTEIDRKIIQRNKLLRSLWNIYWYCGSPWKAKAHIKDGCNQLMSITVKTIKFCHLFWFRGYWLVSSEFCSSMYIEITFIRWPEHKNKALCMFMEFASIF